MKRMKNVKRSPTFLRKRKMLLLLPVMVLPFLTMGFWALGGGQGTELATADQKQGLNVQLPSPFLKEESGKNKLSFYEQAERDSVRLVELMRSDPYYKGVLEGAAIEGRQADTSLYFPSLAAEPGIKLSPYTDGEGSEPIEKKVINKLEALQKKINTADESESLTPTEKSEGIVEGDNHFADEISRLEEMMKRMDAQKTGDPAMREVSAVMDKILDLQHPERVKSRLKETAGSGLAERLVVTGGGDDGISLIDTTKQVHNIGNGFFTLEDDENITGEENAIAAEVHGTQVLMDGSMIKLRLTEEIRIKNVFIPGGSFLFGVTSMDAERLNVHVTSIRHGASIFPINLELYDLDGIAGIYIPGAVGLDVVKQSSGNGLQDIGISTMDPSIKAQATAAGVSSLKTFFSRKIRIARVTVKGGYRVLLRNND